MTQRNTKGRGIHARCLACWNRFERCDLTEKTPFRLLAARSEVLAQFAILSHGLPLFHGKLSCQRRGNDRSTPRRGCPPPSLSRVDFRKGELPQSLEPSFPVVRDGSSCSPLPVLKPGHRKPKAKAPTQHRRQATVGQGSSTSLAAADIFTIIIWSLKS